MQDDMLRHRLIMHESRLDTFLKVGEEVQDIARTGELACSVAPIQNGAVKGNCVRDEGACELCWYLKDKVMVKVRWKEDKSCSYLLQAQR